MVGIPRRRALSFPFRALLLLPHSRLYFLCPRQQRLAGTRPALVVQGRSVSYLGRELSRGGESLQDRDFHCDSAPRRRQPHTAQELLSFGRWVGLGGWRRFPGFLWVQSEEWMLLPWGFIRDAGTKAGDAERSRAKAVCSTSQPALRRLTLRRKICTTPLPRDRATIVSRLSDPQIEASVLRRTHECARRTGRAGIRVPMVPACSAARMAEVLDDVTVFRRGGVIDIQVEGPTLLEVAGRGPCRFPALSSEACASGWMLTGLEGKILGLVLPGALGGGPRRTVTAAIAIGITAAESCALDVVTLASVNGHPRQHGHLETRQHRPPPPFSPLRSTSYVGRLAQVLRPIMLPDASDTYGWVPPSRGMSTSLHTVSLSGLVGWRTSRARLCYAGGAGGVREDSGQSRPGELASYHARVEEGKDLHNALDRTGSNIVSQAESPHQGNPPRKFCYIFIQNASKFLQFLECREEGREGGR
ncbi:hypothetical protein C8R45DRAFT_1125098 [Mycena sanguinolenta]|nr:hypothetical protein C8R45DRAFT_1125098 [Mycena sanguinolenta]